MDAVFSFSHNKMPHTTSRRKKNRYEVNKNSVLTKYYGGSDKKGA